MQESEERNCAIILANSLRKTLLGTTEKWTGLDFKSGLVSASLVDFEVPKGEGNGLDHLFSPPYADFHDVLDDIGDQVDIDLLAEINMRDVNLVIVQGDTPIPIHDPCFV